MKPQNIITEMVIEASPQSVWEVLLDLKTWSHWNPFIISSTGTPKEGETLVNTLSQNGKTLVFKPIVTRLKQDDSFEWLGTAVFGGFKGRHFFRLEKWPNGATKLVHGETFSGFLAPLIFPLIKKQTQEGFIEMNKALAKEIEKRNLAK